MTRPDGSNSISPKWWIGAAAVVVAAVGVIAFVSYGSLGPKGTPKQQMEAWVTGSGLGQNIGTLHADGEHVNEVITKDKGTGAVHTVCGVLTVDAESANSTLPSPDTRLTQILAKAYGLEYDAGNDCYRAGATNTKLLAKSATERAQAQALFLQALARVAAVGGSPLSTTTTTSPATTTASIFG